MRCKKCDSKLIFDRVTGDFVCTVCGHSVATDIPYSPAEDRVMAQVELERRLA